ncbi:MULTISPECIES: peptide-methionine (R)-S-oxide reductase MsrB [unclassified Mucilaginibacter]|uniref:peptide-methionine (R)-S-oxide reductase MsrB n=1 Tax=unclassified Mucilaginibacter TaxID=2617802 RepID=UPI002AC966AD|nr:MULTISPECIES: peptide-methionine (R)-S-oxide reductase MsrB [unclassified Mucilaginibacter]MEB0261236.1 peptide-methionine (R)-S-oxide reductase MsrB [Mucilaginibacter sp. 10I4]MEB0279060.1 peptide-methionine (R)-S-oxide reductase MsrB [Mucilaginibacter sp. 10B2]MEB0299921.1 peptide-methionine (R)-S-oxide reductase MsrB [Mucilaginibacter sp. 5C4]WPX22238.1 peptide-methionine (R)-S-oxide reductase MsrB [Mucilaginibacter sp. 5C4]
MKRSILAILIVSMLSTFGCDNSNGQNKKTQENRPMAKPASGWKQKLTANQYEIMVNRGTEPPFQNAYHDNHQKGVYLSAATGEVLFSSEDKFDSGTGWPSFVKAVDPNKVEIVHDSSFGMSRDEVIEKSTGLHLGHVFDDGPKNRGGKRYCMNSGALVFVKK